MTAARGQPAVCCMRASTVVHVVQAMLFDTGLDDAAVADWLHAC